MRAFSATHDDYSNLGAARKLIRFMEAPSQPLPAEDVCMMLHLMTILSRRTDNRDCLASEGGIGVVLQSMRTHPAVVTVQKQGCAALWNLVVKSAGNRVRVASQGGVELLIAAMNAFPAEKDVQRLGAGVLCSLSSDGTLWLLVRTATARCY